MFVILYTAPFGSRFKVFPVIESRSDDGCELTSFDRVEDARAYRDQLIANWPKFNYSIVELCGFDPPSDPMKYIKDDFGNLVPRSYTDAVGTNSCKATTSHRD